MRLKELFQGLDYKVLRGNEEEQIKSLQYDSRKITQGDAFFCIQGYSVDGHNFINNALLKGAKVIVCDKSVNIEGDCTIIKVPDGRKALALCASNYYGRPSSKIKILGVTGTNGKTTSTFMIKHILEAAGFKVGLLGTIANYIGNKKIPAQRTTPESLELHQLFSEMVEAGVDYCVMEVSSHSLYLDRVYGVEFSQAIFTNLTQDHLDFHKTFENYYNAKLILLKNSLNSIINIDDDYGKKVFEDIKGNKLTYSIENVSDIQACNINMHSRGIDFDIIFKEQKTSIALNIPGRYNIMNALGSVGACLNEGIDLVTIKKGLEAMECVPGRCEIVSKKYNLDFEIIVDYAHTPDGLQNILKTAREFTKGKLISVFGCGGDRDKTKRPIMGKIGTELSDLAIITSDNPRTEEPLSIIQDIIDGINKNNYCVVENRKQAIKKAIESAEKGDVIVIAGKGHENYQVLKDKTIHFDEREVIEEIINGNN